MKYSISSFIFCLFFICIPLNGKEYNAIHFHLNEGITLFRQKNFADAIVEFENVVTIIPNHITAKMWLGKSYAEIKNYKQATLYFKEVLKIEPNNKEALDLMEQYSTLANFGPATDDIGDTPKPIKSPGPAQKMLNISPSLYSEDLNNYSTLVRRIKKYGLVMPEKIVRAELQPKLRLSKFIGKKIERKPTPLDRMYRYLAQDKIFAAIKEYLQAVDRNKNVLALSDRGLIQLGEEYLLKELQVYPNDIELLFLIGKLVYIQGRYDDAKSYLVRLHKLSPTSDQARKSQPILDSIITREKLLARIAAAKKAAEELRKQKEIASRLAFAQTQMEGKVGGIQTKIKKQEAKVLFDKGMELYRKGNIESSIPSFEQAVKNDPRNYQFKFQLASAYTDFALAGRKAYFAPAIQILSEIIRKDPLGKFSKDAHEMLNDIKAITSN
ncbi:tetratricopeptide repeat protein [Candidatus Riflebacteria bacterium]